MREAFRGTRGTIRSDRGRSAPTEEDMFNTPLALFHDRADADVSLGELREAYADYLRGREKPASAKTIHHYADTLLSFEKSLALHGRPAVLGQLTPATVRTWVSDQRAGRLPSNST